MTSAGNCCPIRQLETQCGLRIAHGADGPHHLADPHKPTLTPSTVQHYNTIHCASAAVTVVVPGSLLTPTSPTSYMSAFQTAQTRCNAKLNDMWQPVDPSSTEFTTSPLIVLTVLTPNYLIRMAETPDATPV